MSTFQLQPIIQPDDKEDEVESKQNQQILVANTNKMLATLDKNIQLHSRYKNQPRTFGANNLTLLNMKVTIYKNKNTTCIPKINFGYSGYTEHFQDCIEAIHFPNNKTLDQACDLLKSALSAIGFEEIALEILV